MTLRQKHYTRTLATLFALLAVLLSGITAHDFRAVTGLETTHQITLLTSMDVSTLHAKTVGDTECCQDLETKPEKGTSDCNTTSAFLLPTRQALVAQRFGACFIVTADHADGIQTNPSSEPPRRTI